MVTCAVERRAITRHAGELRGGGYDRDARSPRRRRPHFRWPRDDEDRNILCRGNVCQSGISREKSAASTRKRSDDREGLVFYQV